MNSTSNSTVAIGVWSVADGQQELALGIIKDLLARARVEEHIIEGALYESVDRSRIIVYLRSDSRAQLEQVLASPDIRAAIRGLEQLGHPHMHMYTVRDEFDETRAARASLRP